MSRSGMKLFWILLAVGMFQAIASGTVLEWSDVPYAEGRFSRIYFDYIPGAGSSTGTFHVINDWITNQDDGGTNGGLNPGEFNRFPFFLGSDSYEIRIYGDGTSEILVNGISNPAALPGFHGRSECVSAHRGWRLFRFCFRVQPRARSDTRLSGSHKGSMALPVRPGFEREWWSDGDSDPRARNLGAGAERDRLLLGGNSKTTQA